MKLTEEETILKNYVSPDKYKDIRVLYDGGDIVIDYKYEDIFTLEIDNLQNACAIILLNDFHIHTGIIDMYKIFSTETKFKSFIKEIMNFIVRDVKQRCVVFSDSSRNNMIYKHLPGIVSYIRKNNPSYRIRVDRFPTTDNKATMFNVLINKEPL